MVSDVMPFSLVNADRYSGGTLKIEAAGSAERQVMTYPKIDSV
jgi:hypothetical protein